MDASIALPKSCIWCRGSLAATDISHVLPECVGNRNQQVLPAGVVCKHCNQYFGSKLEPALLADPVFHTIAVVLQLVDPSDGKAFRDKIFDEQHPPVSKPRITVELNASVGERQLDLDVRYEIAGGMRKSYDRKTLAAVSRAVHKIAFESFAYSILSRSSQTDIDLLSRSFDDMRRWTRNGEPHGHVRPVGRKMGKNVSTEWESRTWTFDKGQAFAIELRLFGDWYIVSLTSKPRDVIADLRRWAPSPGEDVWVLGDTMTLLRNGRS